MILMLKNIRMTCKIRKIWKLGNSEYDVSSSIFFLLDVYENSELPPYICNEYYLDFNTENLNTTNDTLEFYTFVVNFVIVLFDFHNKTAFQLSHDPQIYKYE